MGAGGVDAVSEKDKDKAIKKNLDEQLKPTGGAGQRVTGGLNCFAQFEEDYRGFSDVSTSVDAALSV